MRLRKEWCERDFLCRFGFGDDQDPEKCFGQFHFQFINVFFPFSSPLTFFNTCILTFTLLSFSVHDELLGGIYHCMSSSSGKDLASKTFYRNFVGILLKFLSLSPQTNRKKPTKATSPTHPRPVRATQAHPLTQTPHQRLHL